MAVNRTWGTSQKYDEACHLRIVQAIKLGATKAIAASAGGISERTLRFWMASANNDENSLYIKLRQDIAEAEGQSATHALACVVKASQKGDWKAAAWLLERKFGYKRDGVRELREVAVLPGSLEQHETEILAEVRRLRLDASQSGSYVSAATLMRMETEMLTQRRAIEKEEEEASHSNANETELLSIISQSVEGMPKAVLDELFKIISEKRKRAV